ncbi:MAG: hypothetical protein H0U64_02355 [Gemmatimonadaceae bacterium]|nr:hypothetical protein [Gemmatimonadaceae bacterium]
MSKNLLACLIAGFGLACASSPTAPEEEAPDSSPGISTTTAVPPKTPKSAGVQGGNTQSATVATALPNVLSIWVVDEAGKGIPGVPVTFAITVGGGQIESAKATTNSVGIASSGKWILGAVVGAQLVTVTVDGRGITVPFAATGLAVPTPAPAPAPAPTPAPAPAPVASSAALTGGNNQAATAGRGIRSDITMRVVDASGNAFPNATITLAAGNGGSVSPSSIVTNSSGVAIIRGWTLGPATGAQTLSARVVTGPVNPTITVSAIATGVRIVTFGDSNTDQGYAGGATAASAFSYISFAQFRPTAFAANSSTQVAGKIETRWTTRYSPAIIAVNHAIGGTTTGAGRTMNGSPNAMTVVNGVTRFEGEVLGMGNPWNGGEPVNWLYSSAIVRTRSFVPTVNDFVYVSMGTNDEYYGISAAQTLANITSMIDRWIAKGLPADHFMVTTLAPSPVFVSGSMPALNAGIRALATSKGVRVIDLASYVSPDNGLTWRSQGLVIQDGVNAHYVESVRDWIADQVATIMGEVTVPR